MFDPHSYGNIRELDDVKAIFTYSTISKSKFIVDPSASFSSSINDKSFINFGYVGDNPAVLPPPGASSIHSGWKLHLAIYDADGDNVAKAWDALKDILINYRIAESKVIKPGISFSQDPIQYGKQITIYQFYNPNRDWARIVNEIETALRLNDIRPAACSPSDKRIPGSNYISYRNDLDKDNKSNLDAKAAMKTSCPYNPFSREDPLIGIVITG